jgi:two-component system, OmpR family, KDP operon response regulator KdpE
MPAVLPVALVVDDEAQVRRAVREALANDFSRVLESGTGREAVDLAAAQRPGLVVLDIGLPDMAGVDACAKLRSCVTAPILVLSARYADLEKVSLFDAGADHYMMKPFSANDFREQARALMRRDTSEEENRDRIEFGDVVMDFSTNTLTLGERAVHLTRIEWALLRSLARQAGKVLTHYQLFTDVWGGQKYGDAQQYLRVHVANLRRKIENHDLRPRLIVTEPGIGYRFDPP